MSARSAKATDHEPFQDPAAERATLAGVIKGGFDRYCDVSDLITNRTFTIDSNSVIWECVQKGFEEHGANFRPDFLSIVSLGQGYFDKDSEQRHLRAVMGMTVDEKNARMMAAKIRKLEIARTFHAKLGEIQIDLEGVTGEESISAIRNRVESPILDFTTELDGQTSGELKRVGVGLREKLDFIAKNPRENVGLQTGFPRFDNAIGGGLVNGSVNVVGARAKAGKSSLGLNMSLYIAARLGLPVLVLDTELTEDQYWFRLIGRASGVPWKPIQKGKETIHNNPKVANGLNAIEKINLTWKSVKGMAFEDILPIARRWIMREVGVDQDGKAKPCLVVYDYIKLMDASPLTAKLSETQVIGFMMTALHSFAGKWDLPILTFAQLNRSGIEDRSSDVLALSDRILWYCTSLSLFGEKSDEERVSEAGTPASKFDRFLMPIATRDGPGIKYGDYINIESNLDMCWLKEGPLRSELSGSLSPRNSDEQISL